MAQRCRETHEGEGEEEDEEADNQQLLRQQRCFGLSCGLGGNSGASYKTGKGGKNRLDIDDNGGIEGGRDSDGRASAGNEEGGGSIVGSIDAGLGPSSNPFSRVPVTSTSFSGSSSSSSTVTTAAAAATAQTVKSSAGCLPLFEPPPTASHRASLSRTDPSPAPGSGTCSPSGRAVSGVTASCLGGPVWPDPSIGLGSAACVGMSGKGSKRPEVLEPLLEEGSEEEGRGEEVGEEEGDGELGGGSCKDETQRSAAAADAAAVVEGDAVCYSGFDAAAAAAAAASPFVAAAAAASPSVAAAPSGAASVSDAASAAASLGEVVAGGAVAAGAAPSELHVPMSIGSVGEAPAERGAAGEGEANTKADAEAEAKAKTAGSAITTTTASAAAATAATASAAATAATTAPAANFSANAPTSDHGTSRLIPGLSPVSLGSPSIVSSLGGSLDKTANLLPRVPNSSKSISNPPSTDVVPVALLPSGMPRLGVELGAAPGPHRILARGKEWSRGRYLDPKNIQRQQAYSAASLLPDFSSPGNSIRKRSSPSARSSGVFASAGSASASVSAAESPVAASPSQRHRRRPSWGSVQGSTFEAPLNPVSASPSRHRRRPSWGSVQGSPAFASKRPSTASGSFFHAASAGSCGDAGDADASLAIASCSDQSYSSSGHLISLTADPRSASPSTASDVFFRAPIAGVSPAAAVTSTGGSPSAPNFHSSASSGSMYPAGSSGGCDAAGHADMPKRERRTSSILPFSASLPAEPRPPEAEPYALEAVAQLGEPKRRSITFGMEEQSDSPTHSPLTLSQSPHAEQQQPHHLPLLRQQLPPKASYGRLNSPLVNSQAVSSQASQQQQQQQQRNQAGRLRKTARVHRRSASYDVTQKPGTR
ncbi:unnamed protein product [Closterium sp. NIES-53]